MNLYAQFLLLLATVAHHGSANPGVVITQVVDSFKWQDPFGAYTTPQGFQPRCEATATFRATQHVLTDLHKPPPIGLQPWADAIKYFFGGRPFPGAWDGIDVQGVEREVIMMEYVDVPDEVKDWIEDQKQDPEGDKFLFAVYEKPTVDGGNISGQAKRDVGKDEDKIVLFAPGAIYEILPLWVAKGSDCESELLDLGKYNAEPLDDGVVAWVVNHSDPDRAKDKTDITFQVKAQIIVQDPAAKEAVTSSPVAAEPTGTEDNAAIDPEITPNSEKDEL